MIRAASRHRRRLAALLGTLLLGAAPVVARAAVGAQADETYGNARITSTDAAGQRSRSDSESLAQRYRLSLDNSVYPLVRFQANGLLDWSKGWARTDGVPTDSDAKTWNGNAHLTFGTPVLSGGLDYDRREETFWTRTAGVATDAPALIRDTYAASGSWRPLELPSLDLRLSRTDAYDRARRGLDTTSEDVQLTSRFDPLPSLDVRYSARYAAQENRIGGTRVTDITNSATVTWTDRFLGDRGSAYVSYAIASRNSNTSALSANAAITTQRSALAGLSLVEGPIDTPTRVTLTANGALIDGVITATAGINLGYNASAAGVVTPRDVGAQLPNDVTRVSLVYVYVDRNVAPIADQLAWTAYTSIDNVTWTELRMTGGAFFDPLQLRFEIPVQPTAARYVKVVTRPITRQLTSDPRFADVFVTELQLYDVVPASEVLGRTTNTAGALNATARLLLVRAVALAYDTSVLVAHSDRPSLVTYAFVNGLSAQRRLAEPLVATARVDRTDSDAGKGHEGLDRWSGALSYDPFPTLAATLAYTGQLAERLTGNLLQHTASLLARADLYEGISSSVNGSAGWSRDERGRVTRSTGGTIGASIVPNTMLTTTASASVSRSVQTGAGLPDQTDTRGILELTASSSPFRALSLAGSVAHFFGSTGTSTLYNFNGALSLFPRGDLRLGYAYQEMIDTGFQSRTRTHGPTARWTIRPGWFLTSAYSFQHSTSPALTTDGQAFSANLIIAIR